VHSFSTMAYVSLPMPSLVMPHWLLDTVFVNLAILGLIVVLALVLMDTSLQVPVTPLSPW